MINRLQERSRLAVPSMSASHEQAEVSVGEVKRVQESIDTIDRNIHSISGMAASIAGSANEQSRVTAEIDRNIVGIADSARTNLLEAEKFTAHSDELKDLTGHLHRCLSQFRY